MAINTRNRRSSVQAYLFGMMRPLADGTINTADRATLNWMYSGLTYTPTPPGSANEPWSGFICNMGRMMTRRG